MDLAEVLVRHVPRVDARSQAAHQPGPGGLPEDRRADGVHAHQRQVGIQLPQYAGDARGVSTGAHAAHEDVDVPQLGGEFEGERRVGGGVVRVVVLVGAPAVRVLRQQLGDAVAAGLLPAAGRVGLGDDVDLGSVGGEEPGHGGFQARVGDQGDGMAVDHAREGEAEPEGSTGGLDDAAARLEVAAGAGTFDHVQAGAVLDAPGIEAFQLGPEAAAGRREGLGDPQQRRVADEPGQGGADG